ncbi:FecR family protein [Mariniphaga sediminis]|uniref:FecR family protein n=1 Tax=Mariniphaga sediminis TaxID=1628158 RepID=UPI003569A074
MYRLLEKYFSGKCTGEEYQEVVSWIKDPANDLFLGGALKEKWKESLEKDNKIQPDEQLLDSIHHRIALKEQSKRLRHIRIYRQLLVAAAVLIIGLVIHILFFSGPSSPRDIITHNVTVPYGGKTNISLPDGSVVWINSGSTFSYPTEFKDERVVEINGEAFFDVVSMAEPFIVKSSFGEVKVLGTEFNMKAYENEPFETTLVKGAVLFTGKNGKEIKLKPGMQVVVAGGIFESGSVDTELFTSWKEGKLIFKDEPLQNVIARLERWYNVDIELKDDQIKNLKFNGTIEMETFSEVLELIKVTTSIKYSFDRETRVLTIASD